jgi:hypothetical protein
MLNPEIDRLREEMGGIFSRLDYIERYGDARQGMLGGSNVFTVAIPSANQLRNGDLSHSVNTWADETAVATDRAKECVYWFTHDAPAAAQELSDAFNPTTPNKALKQPAHSAYDPDYCDWDVTTGVARLNGTKTLDAPLPANLAVPGRTEEVALIAARRTPFIEIPETCRMFAGVWDNTSGQRNWITDAFALTASVTGTPAGTVERRYKVFVETDKGVTFSSDEVVVAAAPNDASFSSSNVLLRWLPVEGVLRYVVYRYTPGTGVYLKLEEISNGSLTYIDLNTSLKTETGYPSADFTSRKALYYTNLGEIGQLAVNGIDAKWNTIAFPIVIPDQYQQSVTTGRQWIRIGLTETPNLLCENCTVNGTVTIVAPEEVFTAEMVGLTIELFDGVNTLTTTVATFINGTRITTTVAPSWTNSTTTVRILQGGFFAVLVDLIHCGYQRGNLYAPHPEDIKTRTLQPASAPNGSTQGGTGIPPPIESGYLGDDGGIRCVVLDTPIKTALGHTQIGHLGPRAIVTSGNLKPNTVYQVIDGSDHVRDVWAANGAYVRCTDTHRFITGRLDEKGVPLHRLRVGDSVLTEKDGRIESSRIIAIGQRSTTKERVRTLVLGDGHLYCAGKYSPRSVVSRLWALIKQGLTGKTTTAGFFAHNRKSDTELESYLYY